MFQGKIILRGIFFAIDGSDKQPFVKNDLFYQLLPHDIVLYDICGKYIEVKQIIFRETIFTIGILKECDGTGNAYFHTPLLPRSYQCYAPFDWYVDGDADADVYVILRISYHGNSVIQYYPPCKERDHQILIDLYQCGERGLYPLRVYKDPQLPSFYDYDPGKRVDLRHLYTFNIDPPASKDFDDAISISDDLTTIYVHIVDANQLYYPISKIEKRMAYLGFTYYSPLQNLNILPDHLAEDRFSLIQDKDRNVITVEMKLGDVDLRCFSTDSSSPSGDVDVNVDGKVDLPIESYAIYKSTIRVKERFDYESADSSPLGLEESVEKQRKSSTLLGSFGSTELQRKSSGLRKDVRNMLYNIVHQYYQRRINICSPTYKINHETMELDQIVYEDYNSWTHRFIEMMMIRANRIITEHAAKMGFKIPQRYHDAPYIDPEEGEGMDITGDPLIDGIIMIQKYKNAMYDRQKSGHYGLNLKLYTHFTSPIRRYHDVIVMRMMDGYVYDQLDGLLEHLNKREELNSACEKLYKKWKLAKFISKNMESVYEAHIINVSNYGMKFYIKSLGYDGFLRSGGSSGSGVGEKIRIKCVKVDMRSFDDLKWEVCL